MNSKPNILYIFSDQFRGDCLGCLGGPARTPNLDLLAREGVCFTNCDTVAPLCVPARISLITGKYPHTTGAWNNATYILSPEADLFTKAIRDAGYSSAVIGKLHLHSDYGDMTAYESVVRGYGFDYVNEISGPHSTCDTRTHMSDEWDRLGLLEDYRRDMATRDHPFAAPTPLPLEEYYDVYVGREASRFLRDYRGEKPWFCHVSFGGPHEPWDAPAPYDSLYAPADMPAPLPVIRESAENRPRGEYDRLMAKTRKVRCDETTAGKLRANYAGNVTLIDEQIGRLIETVKQRGEWDNTVVLFVSDHGEMNGDHGLTKKRLFLEGALRVPLILRTPETAAHPASRRCHRLVSLMDVGPTLAELAGSPLCYEQQGRSLTHLLEDPEAPHRDYILSEYAGEIMYKTTRWKLVLNREGQPYLLFDLEADPEECLNLAGDPACREIEAELSLKALRAISETTVLDPGVLRMPPIPEHGSFSEYVTQARSNDYRELSK